MNIISAIPLVRSKIQGPLSYFTSLDIPVGAIVSVPMRSKTVHAIVVETRPAVDLKSEIKSAPFEIKRLTRVKSVNFFPASFVESCKFLADYYATTLGAVLDTLVSDTLLENASTIPPALPMQASFVSAPPTTDETYAIQGDDTDRTSSWRSLIRQEFARKKSIAIYVPTIEDAKNVHASLQKGIEGYIFMLTSGLSPKKILETWKSIADTTHPVVIIATGSFAILPRSDIETVLIERENGRGWIGQKQPYLDIRHAIETIARREHKSVYLADSLLRAETQYRLSNHLISEASPFKWRSVSTAVDGLVDMKAYKAAENEFRILSPDADALIEANKNASTHLFMLAVRRGHSPMTVCDDCETIVVCNNCSAPVVLHNSPATDKNFFMCHVCGERRSADERCRNCDSWRLSPLGIGIDRVAEEIRTRHPDVDIVQIDSDSTSTDKQVSKAIETFRGKPGSVLLGTEMALLHLADKVDHVIVASLDSLFALPDFRIEEKVMYTLIRLRTLATRSILVQTRRIEEKVFEYGLKGNLSDFNRSNIEARKGFNYPPFSILVKITLEGKKDEIAEKMSEIQKLVDPYEIDIFPAFTSTVRGNSVIHGLMKIDPNRFPDPELTTKLRSLGHGVSVKINPESLL